MLNLLAIIIQDILSESITGDTFSSVVDKVQNVWNDFALDSSFVSLGSEQTILVVSKLKFSLIGIEEFVVSKLKEVSVPLGLVPLVVFAVAVMFVPGICILDTLVLIISNLWFLVE